MFPGRPAENTHVGAATKAVRVEGKRETKKRQPPVPIPPRLLAHLRRWQAKDSVRHHVVEWNGVPIKSLKTAFKHAVALAGLDGQVTPHTLRHTAATWLMQAGVDKWEAAGFLGMTVDMLDRVYGHHHPQHLQRAAKAIGYRPRAEKLVELLVNDQSRAPLTTQIIENVGGGRSQMRTRLHPMRELTGQNRESRASERVKTSNFRPF
jgi:hypothetical protein